MSLILWVRAHHTPSFPYKVSGRKLKFWSASEILSLTFGIKEDKVFMPTNGCYLGIWVGSNGVTASYVIKLNLEVFYPNPKVQQDLCYFWRASLSPPEATEPGCWEAPVCFQTHYQNLSGEKCNIHPSGRTIQGWATQLLGWTLQLAFVRGCFGKRTC